MELFDYSIRGVGLVERSLQEFLIEEYDMEALVDTRMYFIRIEYQFCCQVDLIFLSFCNFIVNACNLCIIIQI